MKTLAHILVLFISITCFAQHPIEKEIGEFSELKVYDLIEVELIKADVNKVIITGKNTEDVLVNNKNGTLKIKMKLEEAFDGNNTKVKLYYTSFDILDANEGAYIHSKDVIKQFEIDLNAQEGGKIDVKIDTKYVNVRAVTGANIITSGIAVNQDVSIYTGGDYDGKGLKTKTSEVSIRIAGNANINASKKVVAKVRAGGNIYIYGNPEQIDESRVLGGKINILKE
ncbi:head GIN domain-containing protein [Algibacter luteus]|uniref:Putative auto-transporter adhesin, head GIN domain n=1 Tax=Algibacter luteus TaxID=1178825 RepID=A0A1M6DEL8_9FLAO|nr:head GIN domain-containing protein [Algibacter luteus]SHI71438.1 Putative auto-transporter adhesin, head GIN domain [Algibacter luteus]